MKKLITSILIAATLFVSCKKEVYYNVTTMVQPEGSGDILVTPSVGSVLEGTMVSFQANPKGDYAFTGWSGSLSGTENPKTITVTSDITVTANFTLREYPLTISIEGEGSVNERVISTKTEYGSGTVVELIAKPSDHWLFDHWEGDLNGNTNPVQITVSSPKSVKAVFVKKMYDLTVNVEGEGAVSETIKETRSGSYQEGTVVELTATPATGWSFDHWEGDLTSTDNPAQVLVTSAKSVKAVFVKNKYSYSLKIVGPGAVDEYLIETKADYEYGTDLQLMAYPDVAKHALFQGWSGDVSGNNPELSLSLEKDMSIVATFVTEAKKHSLPDLHLPTSVRKEIFYDVSFPDVDRSEYCALDYNRDGYVDFVTCYNSGDKYRREPINFYMCQPDGSFLLDEKNSGKFDGLTGMRKSLYGDFNGDNLPDICFVGHGYDPDPGPGEYPVLLLSGDDGQYHESRLTDVVGYYHGSAAGDFDNDGDLDIFLLDGASISNSKILENDGSGKMAIRGDLINHDLINSMGTCEFFDLNHDGFLDILIGGAEHEGKEWHQYTNAMCIIWGNGESFNHDNYDFLPIFKRGWGEVLDAIFYDLDGDGKEEIISSRTGDSVTLPGYIGWAHQVVAFDGESFSDVTYDYFAEGEETDNNTSGRWIVRIGIEEIEGAKYLVGLDVDGKKKVLFEIIGKRFSRCEDKSAQPLKYDNGMCFYSDGIGEKGEHVQLGCQDSPYGGNTCIHFSNWPLWNGWGKDYEDWVDFSELEKQGYVLEFAIKNTDPDLVIAFQFETRLQTDPWYFPSYGYTYFGSEHTCDGSWELVRVPLSAMTCDPEWTGYYWNTIKTFNIMPGECHGQDFYLDEIRIRKVLPE